MKQKKNNTFKSSEIINTNSDNVLISVLQSLPVGVIIYSLKNILFANSSAFKLLKFDKKLLWMITDAAVIPR